MTILGRVVKWTEEGIEYEADPRHRRALLERFGLTERCKALTHNGEAKTEERDEAEDEFLVGGDISDFRACEARLTFSGQDSSELQFLAKGTAKPVASSWRRLKKAVRFLIGRRRVVWEFGWQEEVGSVHVFADSDWGGDRVSRKSTSGGAILLGQHCLRTWSSTQGAVASSSAEAEFYALIDAVLT